MESDQDILKRIQLFVTESGQHIRQATSILSTMRKNNEALLMHVGTEINNRMEALATKESAWAELQVQVQSAATFALEKVKLDIGGTVFSVAKSLLLSFKDSLFHAMLSSGRWLPGKDGTYFIDRTPWYFGPMLDFMRNGKLTLSRKMWCTPKMQLLREEFDFYQIPMPMELHEGPCQGRFARMWGKYGSENGEFRSPQVVAVSDINEVYVLDKFNCRVQVFDVAGRFLRLWNLPDKLFDPKGMAVGLDRVFIVDRCGNCVQVFSPQGQFLYTFGSRGNQDGQLRLPTGIALDQDSQLVYVIDGVNHRVQVFHPQGLFVKQIPLQYWMRLVENVIITQQMLILADNVGHVCVYDTRLECSLRWKTLGIKYRTLAISKEGEVYVCAKDSNVILVCNVFGKIQRSLDLKQSPNFEISYIGLSKNGYVFLTDERSDRVLQLY